MACDEVDESVPHPRGYGNNARVLGRYVRELQLISLEDAIRKMTSLPAQTFGFRDRGLVREGFAADLVIFDEKTIGDRATFDKPHQYPVGMSYVIVNGELVFGEWRDDLIRVRAWRFAARDIRLPSQATDFQLERFISINLVDQTM